MIHPALADATIQPAGWSLGVYIGLPVAALVALLCLLFLAACLISDDEDRGLGIGISVVVLLGTLALAGFAMWPWQANYHRYYAVTGTVDQDPGVRMIADGKSMSQRIVLVVGGVPYGVDDTRATLVHKGDHVSLMCKRDYQFRAQPGWVCNWNGTTPVRGTGG